VSVGIRVRKLESSNSITRTHCGAGVSELFFQHPLHRQAMERHPANSKLLVEPATDRSMCGIVEPGMTVRRASHTRWVRASEAQNIVSVPTETIFRPI